MGRAGRWSIVLAYGRVVSGWPRGLEIRAEAAVYIKSGERMACMQAKSRVDQKADFAEPGCIGSIPVTLVLLLS